MKKFFLSISTILIVSLSACTVQRPSSLIVKTTKEDVIKVAIDDLPFSNTDSEVAVRNLEKGKHYLRVVKVNHSINPFKPKSELLFEGYVNVRPRREILAVINSHNRLMIVKDSKAGKASLYYDYPLHQDKNNNLNINVNLGGLLTQMTGLL